MDENEIENEENAETDSIEADKPCPPGYHWDPTETKCVED